MLEKKGIKMCSDKGRVGVLMQVYRNEPSMHRAIKSVLNQSYKNIKYYILVSDDTRTIVQNYAEQDQRIEVLEGSSEKGFRHFAKYVASDNNRYITGIDADDWYDDKYIEELISFAENQGVDIVACGNYFMNAKEEIVGVRRQRTMVWAIQNTPQVLEYVYGFLRTIWGKLISSNIVIEWDEEKLPTSEQYGGYGGDTLFVVSLLYNVKKVGITDKVLYYYRVSETSTSRMLKPGRLKSDEILFYYVKDFLSSVGNVGDRATHFLYAVYGNALWDTLVLLKQVSLAEEERVKNIYEVLSTSLTEVLLLRDRLHNLDRYRDKNEKSFSKRYYTLIFGDLNRCFESEDIMRWYYKIFLVLFPEWNRQISFEDFEICIQSKKILNGVVEGQFGEVFNELLYMISASGFTKKNGALSLLQRLEMNPLVRSTLVDIEFVSAYAPVISLLNCNKLEEALDYIKNKFEKDGTPNYSNQLIELWLNIAALLENEYEFIEGKKVQIGLLIQTKQFEAAEKEYGDLAMMGVSEEELDNIKLPLH